MRVGHWEIRRANYNNGRSDWPRVGLLHSFYRSNGPSGENLAVESQFRLLARHGVDVKLIGIFSDSTVRGSTAHLKTYFNVATGGGWCPPPDAEIQDLDLLHIHNLFPNISHRWVERLEIPAIATAHNYRAFCAIGTFSRNGHRCFECQEHSPRKSVENHCYRDSRIATLPIAIQQLGHHSLGKIMSGLPRVLIPGEPMHQIFRKFGLTNTLVLEQPTSADGPLTNLDGHREDGWLFAGRIDREKGIMDLVRVWPRGKKLVIVGEGPDSQSLLKVVQATKKDIEILGPKSQHDVAKLMGTYRGLVFPSRALEGAPMVYAEALKAGMPLVAAHGNTLAAQVLIDGTGAVFELKEKSSLRAALAEVSNDWHKFSLRCVNVHESRYTPETWLRRIHPEYLALVAK